MTLLSLTFWKKSLMGFFILFIVCLPFSKSLVEISVVGILLCWLLLRLSSVKREMCETALSCVRFFRPERTPLDRAVLFFLVAALISMSLSMLRGTSWILNTRGLFKILEWFSIFYIGTEVFKEYRNAKVIAQVLLGWGLVMIFDGLFQMVFGFDLFRGYSPSNPFQLARIQASFKTANAFSAYLVLMVPPMLMVGEEFLASLRKRKPTLAMILRICGFSALVLCFTQTRTRSGWLGLLAGLLFLLGIRRKEGKTLLIWALIFSIFLLPVLLNWMITSKPDQDNLTKKRGDEVVFLYSAEDFQKRLELWGKALSLLHERPFFGHGLNTYSYTVHQRKSHKEDVVIYPHNSYLQLAAEMGSVGLFTFLFLLFSLVQCLIRSILRGGIQDSFAASLQSGIIVGIVGFLVKALFDTEFHSLQRGDLFWFFAGLGTALCKGHHEETNNRKY